jgi:hypothetical protein
MKSRHRRSAEQRVCRVIFPSFEWLKSFCHAGDLRNMAKAERRIPQIALQVPSASEENSESQRQNGVRNAAHDLPRGFG